MPLYEYECKQCGAVFEVLERISSQPLTTHNGCGGPVERLLSPPALQFKGSGWYITDYARAPKKHGAGSKESDKASGKAEQPKPAGKAESAPAKASESKT